MNKTLIQVGFNNAAIKLPNKTLNPIFQIIPNTHERLYTITLKPQLEQADYCYVKITITKNITDEEHKETIEYNTIKLTDDYIFNWNFENTKCSIKVEGYYMTNNFKQTFEDVVAYLLPVPVCAKATICSEHLICNDFESEEE